jgi:hypothetical protein
MRSPLDRVRRAGDPAPPAFIGVGALGSGTGWWHAQLLAHPEIEPPRARRRALHFFDRFCTQELTESDVAAYHARFPRRPGVLSGEWTGRYMFDAWTPPLLHRVAPDARLLALISDPIERYRAIFRERMAKRIGDETFSTADLVDRASYATQIGRLQRFYSPQQILVLQLERCRRDPLGQYRRTLEFLDVRDTGFAPRSLRRKADGKPESPVVEALLRVGLPAGTRSRIAERFGGRTTPARDPVALWPELETALHTALDPEVTALRQLVPDLDLSLWPNFASVPARSPARTSIVTPLGGGENDVR